MADDDWYKPDRAPTPQRQPTPGELLFEFHVERTHTFYRVELRDHGEFGVEAQFLDPDRGTDSSYLPPRLGSKALTTRDGDRVGGRGKAIDAGR